MNKTCLKRDTKAKKSIGDTGKKQKGQTRQTMCGSAVRTRWKAKIGNNKMITTARKVGRTGKVSDEMTGLE